MGNNIALLIYVIFIVGVSYFMMRITMAHRRKAGGELSAWRRTPLTKEQQATAREQYTAYRAEVYKDYPEAERFEKNRRRWAAFIILVYLVTAILRSYVQATLDNVGMASMVIGTFAGWFFGAALVFISIERRKLTVLLYVIGLMQLVSYIRSFWEAGIDSWEMLVQTHVLGFRYYPMPVISNVFSIIYSVLLLLTAVWLTAFRRNRELAEQADMLNDKIKHDFKPSGI